MSVQLDLTTTYTIEIDFISENEVVLNLVDGITVYENGVRVGIVRALDFRDEAGNLVNVVLSGQRALVYLDSGISFTNGLTKLLGIAKLGGVLTENTTVEGAGLYSLTLGHLTDALKKLTNLYGSVGSGGSIQFDVDGAATYLLLRDTGTRVFLQSENGIVFLTTGGGIGSTAATTQQLIAGTTLTLGASVGNFTMTTVGGNLFSLANPSAKKLIIINADNTVSVIDPNESIGIACSDETTVLAAASTSVPVATFHAPYALTLTRVFAGLRTAGTGAAVVTVDIHINGTTIMSGTKILFTASQKLSADGVLTTTALAAGDYVEIFLDQRDTNNVATGLKTYLLGYKT